MAKTMMAQRQFVILKGETRWHRNAVLDLLCSFDASRCVCLSNEALGSIPTIGIKKAQTVLGQEFDAVVIDGSTGLNPDSLGAMVGTVVAGGALIILLNNEQVVSVWLQRFLRISERYQQSSPYIHLVEQDQDLPSLSAPISLAKSDLIVNADQQQAINAVLKVVSGHRRRPLVLTADRGRGKSAALGMAAAELLKQGKQTILVTAPSFASAETIFEHARRLLPESVYSKGLLSLNNALIKFMAPDALVESNIKADLVLVDEAAAIPVALLEQLLTQFSRLVFSSTIHGYEGTGRGFAIRFQHTLDQKTPDWNRYHITQPIRWRDDDLLEQFSFDALLLNASSEAEAQIADATIDVCQFEKRDQQSLVDDEVTLRSLFGLMVQAHYRTRPSDLMMLLDSDDISIYIMRYQGHVIASCLCVEEGSLSPELADAIYSGERRLKGHLLPQSLLAHAGLVDAGGLSYQRIIRLAVHPVLQRQGIGQAFVRQIVAEVEKEGADLVGASFASSVDVIGFWSQCGFSPMRLGLHHDEVSGSHSMMMLKPLSTNGQDLVAQGLKRFGEQWPFLLQQHFQHLSSELVVMLSQLLDISGRELLLGQRHELAAFAFKQRGFEVCQFNLSQAASLWVTQAVFLTLSKQQQALCVMLLLQSQQVSDVAKRLGFTGKSQVIVALREAVAILLE